MPHLAAGCAMITRLMRPDKALGGDMDAAATGGVQAGVAYLARPLGIGLNSARIFLHTREEKWPMIARQRARICGGSI